MWDNWSATALLVHLAALTYVAGFLIRNQLMLRGLILIGTGLYIAYYYLAPETPLWDAIGWSVVMGLANAYTMMRIINDRRPCAIAKEDRAVYRAMPQVAPSDFRRILALAEKATVQEDTVLLRPGSPPDYLYFIVSGEVLLKKQCANKTTRLFGRSHFFGEGAYILNRPETVGVTLGAGGRYLRWKVSDLRSLAAKTESVQLALETAFNRDLAVKVAAS